MAGWLAGCSPMVGSLVGWLADWLGGRPDGWMDGWLADWLLVGLAGWLAGWLASWLDGVTATTGRVGLRDCGPRTAATRVAVISLALRLRDLICTPA